MEWFNTNTEFRVSEYQTSGIVGCTSAVGLAIAALVFAPAKITKIKDAIKAAGGTVKFVTKVLETYKVAKGMGLSTMEAIKMGVQEREATEELAIFFRCYLDKRKEDIRTAFRDECLLFVGLA
ncbi:hypothetical protein SAMN04488689_1122 [Paenibacillus sp. cl6col]|nr:hypothetical protein SAMN04488689_1122 [Paenibacillus sp. cl6col]